MIDVSALPLVNEKIENNIRVVKRNPIVEAATQYY